jgi:DNA-binding IclR family transcriptional regulator
MRSSPARPAFSGGVGGRERACVSNWTADPRLAELNRSRVDLVALAQPLLRELRDLTGETVTLCEIRKPRGFCLDFAESPQSVRMTVYRGETFPLNAGAIGKALLALNEEFVDAVLRDAELSACTHHR